MATPVCIIDETGIHAPAFDEILTYFKEAYRGIYGQDLYLENDSQDGQLLGIFAAAINDANAMAVAVYNAFSPSTAQGEGLSRVVKINGIRRAIPSRSSVDLVLVGQGGTTIGNGAVTDAKGTRWMLPASVTIPAEGQITVTAQAEQLGAVTAGAGTVTQIATPTRGWQSATNPLAAVPGAPVEADAALRRRQSVSTALPSRTILEGIIGAVASLAGVTRYAAYENDMDVTDANGIPSHTIALVVEGGTAADVAAAIASKKGAGSGTYGTTSQDVTDSFGIPHTIRFFRPTKATIKVAISVKAMPGYTAAIESGIKDSVAAWINQRAIGEGIEYFEVATPANFYDGPNARTFKITALQIGKNAGPLGTSDIVVAFNEAATATAADVTITVVP